MGRLLRWVITGSLLLACRSATSAPDQAAATVREGEVLRVAIRDFGAWKDAPRRAGSSSLWLLNLDSNCLAGGWRRPVDADLGPTRGHGSVWVPGYSSDGELAAVRFVFVPGGTARRRSICAAG